MKLVEYGDWAEKFNNRRDDHVERLHVLGLVAEVAELYEITNYIGNNTNRTGMTLVAEELGDVMWNLHMVCKSLMQTGFYAFSERIPDSALVSAYGQLTREDITQRMVVASGRVANIVERFGRNGYTARQRFTDERVLESVLLDLVGLLRTCIGLHGVSVEFIAEYNIQRLTVRYHNAGIPLNN